MRHVIAHFHTYKNSGSSFDALLRENFGDDHIAFDGPFPYMTINQPELVKVIRRHPTVKAVSSHQIRLPVPTNLWVNVLAAVFVRHPLLRIRSIYSYGRKRSEEDPAFAEKNVDGVSGLASDTEFDDWIRAQREQGLLNHISNAQTQIFSGVYLQSGMHKEAAPNSNKTHMISDLNQAKRNLECVPLLARTEHYNEDVARFSGILADYGIEFSVAEMPVVNASSEHVNLSLTERLQAVEDSLSIESLEWLKLANQQDLALYAHATQLIEG